jgi:hypothetical protein
MRDGCIALAVLGAAALVASVVWFRRNVMITFEPIETEEGEFK